jgi:hypothetical protein
LNTLIPFGFELSVPLGPNQILNSQQIIPLLFKLLKPMELTLKFGLPSPNFSRMAGVIPKVWLGGLLLDFLEFGCQAREVKDTSESLRCAH